MPFWAIEKNVELLSHLKYILNKKGLSRLKNRLFHLKQNTNYRRRGLWLVHHRYPRQIGSGTILFAVAHILAL